MIPSLHHRACHAIFRVLGEAHKTRFVVRVIVGLPLTGIIVTSSGGEPSSFFFQQLPIPSILQPIRIQGSIDRYDLRAHADSTHFFPGHVTPTYGYNGLSYLGPTIRLTRGRPVQIVLHNQLPRKGRDPLSAPIQAPPMGMEMGSMSVPNGTSLHLHGLMVSSKADTTPSPCCHPLAPGANEASPVFTPDQPSATLWYHPHPYMDTGRQVYLGLAGLLLVDDPADRALDLPHTYGVDDLPLIVQDRRFALDRGLLFRDKVEDTQGMLGDRILVNGAITPHADVAATRIRLRLVNASNARTYVFAFGDGRAFQQIATDGGLLPEPMAVDQVRMPPAGRAEIVVDFGKDAGKALQLVSRAFETAPGHRSPSLPDGAAFPVMEFRIGSARSTPPLPPKLAALPAPDPRRATRTRLFELEKEGTADPKGGDSTINDKRFDETRIDEHVKAGAWELWTVINHSRVMAHTFHVHGIQFQVVSRGSGPLVPNDQGWKDTVEVLPEETVQLLLHFEKQVGTYMYHCHNLEHEDMGMMGQYEVTAEPVDRH